MLKTIGLSYEPAFQKNISNKQALKKNNSNSEINRFYVGGNSVKYTKKSKNCASQEKSC